MKLSTEQHAKLEENVRKQFMDSLELKQKFMTGNHLSLLVSMAETAARSICNGGKLLLCGNGGSAADAQHLACELLVRLRPHVNRSAIPALSLALDTSTITACANDFGFECLYERMVEGLGKAGDVLLALTTSGRSSNVIKALEMAKKKNIVTMGFLGGDGGKTVDVCDMSFVVPAHDPNRVQEVHITAGHILMDLIEGIVLEHQT